ncbi:MAG: S8 family peptidase [Bacteroidales bacterium]|jgi:bacillopeptidase F|nr:S8 family peptidase [Bacteroidales bacterium]
MKRKIIFYLYIFLSFNTYSQSEISRQLLDDMEHNSGYINVNIFFYNKLDLQQLNLELNSKKANFDERIKRVTQIQKQNSEFSIINFYKNIELKTKSSKVIKNEKIFWVVNMLNADVKSDFIQEINRFENVKYIDINSPKYKLIDGEKSEIIKEKSVNGAEASLKRINAHKLWELGYTGRNMLFLSVDTGVETEHPAITRNYAGRYFSQNQCWHGIRHSYPTDNDGSNTHGTHTTGTVLGLDRNNNDTIGVAFNSHFIASDPVASSVEELLTPVELLSVYQWALNPDGDENTTNDVPRAINNSWGFDYVTAQSFNPCELQEAEVLITIEVAGICSPFSAGNEGPGNSTIGFPAMRVFNEVNPLSIGALNVNNSIANFSSRGPATCITEEGSLKIKPEVSAPGVNIRSCRGKNSYSYLSGTSMACPHVTGALLLLAEAFPNASAYELKNAIYKTAIDLGVVGEDNIYGNGIIDVFAAYNYLIDTLGYIQKPPIQNDYDLSSEIIYPSKKIICSFENQEIIAKIKNTGALAIENFFIKTYFNNILIDSSLITITLNQNEEYNYLFDLTLINTIIYESSNTINVIAIPVEDIEEYDRFNNGNIFNFQTLQDVNFPYNQNFENLTNISELQGIIENPDFSNTWQLLPWGGNNQFKALGMVFKEYYNNLAEDKLIFPIIQLPNEDSIFLDFNYAYKKWGNLSLSDSLFILISSDCGENFDTIYKNGGVELGTVPNGPSNNYYFYKPQTIDEFANVRINLFEYKNSKIMLKFITKNNNGSVLYIDSLSINNNILNSINNNNNNLDNSKIIIYPNPNFGTFSMEISLAKIENLFVEISNSEGKIIETRELKNNYIYKSDFQINTIGEYFIKIKSDTWEKTEKITIVK